MLKLQINDIKIEKELLLIAQNFDNNLEKTLKYFLTAYKKKFQKPKIKKFDPEKYRGIYQDFDLDVDKECSELRNEWERNI